MLNCRYYSGELRAPMLTIFIGGNHEASNYLQELPYGGWVAPNIYYLGYAGVVRVNGIRIAGVSGIYKGHDYLRGRFEFSPYTEATKRSVYHVRQLEIFRLKQLTGKIDIFMSHDWPKGIYNHGNKQQLARFKPFLREEMDNDKLGSRPCEDLLNMLQPKYWFAAHLHCKFAAIVQHTNFTNSEEKMESKEDLLEHKHSEDDDNIQGSFTKFLALDKCLPKRRFLQILDINSENHTDDEGHLKFEYDLEWLTILYLTNHLVNVKESYYYLPNEKGTNGERYNFTPTEEEMQNVRKKFENDLKIPNNFCRTVEAFDPSTYNKGQHYKQPKSQINPQSLQFCDTLGIDDPLSLAMIMGGHELSHSSTLENTQDSALNDSFLLDDQQPSSLNTSTASVCLPAASSPLKRKSNSGMILPKPKALDEGNNEEIVLDDTKEDDIKEDNVKEDNISTETCINLPAAHVEITSEVAHSPKPPIKKFKRRNQDIYQEKEDEEEGKETT